MPTKSKTEKADLATLSTTAGLLEEDGWLFRERPGVPVECVRRASEGLNDNPGPLYHPRHDYPSA